MSQFFQLQAPEVYFAADMHFRDRALPGEADRRRRFGDFLGDIPPASALFLLGDLFDFFFEYATVVPKRYFDIYFMLRQTVERGVAVHLMGGNHDAWFGDFFREELGLQLHGDRVLFEAQNRKVCCEHGDMCLPGDQGYKRLRAVIRNPAVVKLSKAVHPDLMDAVAAAVSSESKRRSKAIQAEIAKNLADRAPRAYFTAGNDVFVMGHVHFPIHRIHDGRDFMIVGDWVDHFTFGKLQGGRLTLEKARD